MAPNLTHPSEMNLFVRNSELSQNQNLNEKFQELLDLVPGAAKTQLEETPDKFLLEFVIEKIGLKFWIGFADVKSTELFRHDFTTTTTSK